MKRNRRSYIWEFLKSSVSVIKYKVFRIKPKTDRIGSFKALTMQSGNNEIETAILAGEPFAAIRFGAVELGCLNNYEKINLKIKKDYKPAVIKSMKQNAGFFPANKEYLDHYNRYIEVMLRETDVLGISGIHMENYFFNNLTPDAVPIQNWVLDPLLGRWSHLLAGKKVLVVSPFVEQIKKQYAKRHLLFPTKPDVLPDFTLITVKAVQTSGKENDERFQNWFEALDYMKIEILKQEFDIALIGAGAYGTPLCLYVKSLGKIAIQTGGATQLLFGIIGRRWEKRPYVVEHLNKHWIRPVDKPSGYKDIEGGCYW